jgi:hypothetical protein
MSGGSFGYVYHRVDEFALGLQYAIDSEELKLKEETIKVLKNIIDRATSIADMMEAVDYLYSHDTGEETFMEIIRGIEGKNL